MQAVYRGWRRLARPTAHRALVFAQPPQCRLFTTSTPPRLASQDDEIYGALYGASAHAKVERDFDYVEDAGFASPNVVPLTAPLPPPLPRTVPPAAHRQNPVTITIPSAAAAPQALPEQEQQGDLLDKEDEDDDVEEEQEEEWAEGKEAREEEKPQGKLDERAGALLELGIDAVGRGAVVGPIVLAAVALDGDSAEALQRAGVDDKKRPYRSLQREMEMYDTILACVPEGMCKSVHISAEEIDFRRENGETLTDIETDAIETLVAEFTQYAEGAEEENEEVVVVAAEGEDSGNGDSNGDEQPTLRAVRVSAFSQGVAKEAVPRVASMLPPESGVDVSAIQSASVGGKSLAVSAAYVLAKTERALVMKSIERDTGHEIGSGFITDAKVDEFLTACVRRWRERMARKQQLGIAPTSDAILGRSVEANVGGCGVGLSGMLLCS